MLTENYYAEDADGISFTRQQASDFAKQIADDYNPLHNPNAKLFCVPGDLLFALVLARYGVSQRMRFNFSGMIDDTHKIRFAETENGHLRLLDGSGKEYLSVERSGTNNQDTKLVESLTQNYVSFSGHTFPHVLIPLMTEHQVMINPARPIIIYQSMEIDLERVDIASVNLEFRGAQLEVDGKKGNVRLDFLLKKSSEVIGRGTKYMAMRGLRDYDQQVIDKIVDDYTNYKKLGS